MKEELIKSIGKYLINYPEEAVTSVKILDFLLENTNPFSRELQAGHFTASAFLLNFDKTKFLLMNHSKLNMWLQLGGHCDGDTNCLRVAVKEAQEESGILKIEPVCNDIYDIDIHLIPSNYKEPAHYHYDIRFLLKTVDSDMFVKNSESKELKWIEFSSYEYKKMNLNYSLTRMIDKFVNSYS